MPETAAAQWLPGCQTGNSGNSANIGFALPEAIRFHRRHGPNAAGSVESARWLTTNPRRWRSC
jgi:hypothetical protein